MEIQWIPNSSDAVHLDAWFAGLDRAGRGLVGGVEVAVFLQRSHLPREALRAIWSLVDNQRLGYVNKSQFNNLMRLVSISCSPIYMGSAPSLERLKATLYDRIPLPISLVDTPLHPLDSSSPKAASSDGSSNVHRYGRLEQVYGNHSAHVVEQSYPAVHGNPIAVHYQDASNVYSSTSQHLLRADYFSMAQHQAVSSTQPFVAHAPPAMNALAVSPGPGDGGVHWIPNSSDAVHLDAWFAGLDRAGRGLVGGVEVAVFLQRSHLPREALRAIWSLVDNQRLGYVNKSQFNNLVRLVSINCSPIYMGSAPSLDRLKATLYDRIPLPISLVDTPLHPLDSSSPRDGSSRLSSGEAVVVDVQTAVVPSTGGLSFLDEMVEEDLKQHEDDWNDFAEAGRDVSIATTASPAPLQLAAVVPSTGGLSFLDEMVEEDLKQHEDDWNDFAEADGCAFDLMDIPESTVALQYHIPLSLSDLEALAVALSRSCHYEHAYNCIHQRDALRALTQLSELKLVAVERDDLVTATRLKGDIDQLTAKLFSGEEEAKWVVLSKERGETLDDAAAVVSAIDPALGDRFRSKFMSEDFAASVASSAPSVAVKQLRLFAIARRYCKMIHLSRSIPHRHCPQDWLQVLRVVSTKVVEGLGCIARYAEFNDTDREHLKHAPKLITYGRSLIAVAEVGLWVAASCLEAMYHDQLAVEVFQQCRDVLGKVGEAWDLPSKFVGYSCCDDFSIEAAQLEGLRGVLYCGLSLRPLCYERAGDRGGTHVLVALYEHRVMLDHPTARCFMEPLLKLWTHDIADSYALAAAVS